MTDQIFQVLNNVAAGFNFNGSTPSLSLPHRCGELRSWHNGQFVELTGKMTKNAVTRFAELRDSFGRSCQLVILERHPHVAHRFRELPNNVILTIMGQVMLRPARSRNSSMATGDIEVEVHEIGNIEYLPEHKHAGDKRSYENMARSRVTNVEKRMCKNDNVLKYFENRDLTCADLRRDDVGTMVTLVGWMPLIKSKKFFQLKDGHGQTQLTTEDQDIIKMFSSTPRHGVFQIEGKVVNRPTFNINLKYVTGEIEVSLTSAKVIDPDQPYEGPIKTNIKRKILEDGVEDDGECATSHDPCSKAPDIVPFFNRTHHCGELSCNEINQNVVICGWLASQRMNKFFILEDTFGTTQVIVMPKTQGLEDYFRNDVPVNTLMRVEGTVIPRPESTINPKMLTGDIEVKADRVTVLEVDKKNLPKDLQIEHNEE
ncbi:uncharacterized protein [Drosophila bipectinata]|uniref:uncharacterized protein n=1 Tax=Drosophila bipectinata TaxID=42026 RepID=UPI0038B4002C